MEDQCLIKELYQSFVSYDPNFRFFCAHNACTQILRYYGINTPVLLLDCTYDIFLKTNAKNHSCPYNIYIDTTPLLDEKQYIFYYMSENRTSREIWNINKEYISKGSPVILGVDQFYLPYHNEYHKKHGAHAVLLCGYNKDESAFIIDECENCHYKGVIELKQLETARLSENSWNGTINSGGSIKYASLVISPHILPHPLQNIYQSIHRILQKYYITKNAANTEFYGIEAIEFLYDFLKNNHAEEHYNQFFMHLYVSILPVCEKKNLFQYYMEKACHIYNIKGAIELLSLLERLNKSWNVCLKMILKLSYAKTFLPYLYNDFMKLFKQCIAEEKKLKVVLEKVLSLMENKDE